ncbi:MAG: hypothetical protein RBR05_00095 [Candidatus Methanomethylophilaceae archaeon]|jgi:hypothetical protein|nr:hypothetical protein [Candidatus Methanomethylophilaceae archaeon]
MKIFNDKYFLLCISVIMIIFITSYINIGTNESDDSIVGIVYDINESSKGFTFYFQDVFGNITKCFSYDKPLNNIVYLLKGSMSSDNNIFFVSEMIEILLE